MNKRQFLLTILMATMTSPVFFTACCKEYPYNPATENSETTDSTPSIRREELPRMEVSLTSKKHQDTLSLGIKEMSPAVPVATEIMFSTNNLHSIDTNMLKRYLRECDSVFLVPQRSKIFISLDYNSLNEHVSALENLCSVSNHIRIKGEILLNERFATEELASRLRNLGATVVIIPIEYINYWFQHTNSNPGH